jgi:hypothetical protein
LIHALLLVATLAANPHGGGESDEAHRLTVLSIREYNAGDFEAALRDAKRAYELSGLTALLFNLGQCQRALGHWKEAEFAYKAYLREHKDARNRKDVLDLIADMEAKDKGAAPQPPIVLPLPASPMTPPAAPPSPPPDQAPPVPATAITEQAPAPHRVSPATWWLGGSGVAAVVAGSVLGVLANGNDGSATKTGGLVNHDVTGPNYVTGQYEGLSADILWSVGGALVVAAVVVAFTSH